MTPEQENFESLRRLLKLKRYEQPPPRYFNDFSQQVINQIKAGRARDEESTLDRLKWQVPWLGQLLDSFNAKPALAVGFGAAVCALLVGGVIYSENLGINPAKPVVLVPVPPNLAELSTPANAPLGFGLKEPGELAKGDINTNNNSLNPSLPTSPSLFGTPVIDAQPVGFQPRRGN